jgi:hypothetical protein
LLFNQSIQKYIGGFTEQLPVLPEDVDVLLPYSSVETTRISEEFYSKYYSDSFKRALILGINPGRNGAGITGIPFTDTKRLEEKCNIHTISNSHEPSSEFMYAMIEAYGGVDKFYKNIFISSLSPVGFIKNGKNYNYYDDSHLCQTLTPYMIHQMKRLLKLPINKQKIICLGEGKNFNFLRSLNQKFNWFDKIIPLAHPRFVMQYKRKAMKTYINLYLEALNEILQFIH